jgi:hypothetical protein
MHGLSALSEQERLGYSNQDEKNFCNNKFHRRSPTVGLRRASPHALA